jgi:hypothetical protein
MTGGLVGVVRPKSWSHPGTGGRTRTEEVRVMSEVPSTAGGSNGYKTIGVRLLDPIHAQMTLIASLEGMSLTDAIKEAIEYYIERKKSEGGLAERAAAAAEEIERDAELRRAALNALFAPEPEADKPSPATQPGNRRRKAGEQTGEQKP